MKRFLLLCGLLAATSYTVTYAQAVQDPAKAAMASVHPVPPTKSEFDAKVKQLDNLIAAGKTEEATKLYNGDLSNMMGICGRNSKYKSADARRANDASGAVRYNDNMRNQWDIYNLLSDLVLHMPANRAKMNAKLVEFEGTMD